MAQIAAHDGVAFPVTDMLTAFHLDRPLGDRALARQYASGVDAAIALASEFAQDAGVAPQVTADPLVPTDASIDRLMADAQPTLIAQRARDLFGAPLLAQQPRHQRHIFHAEPRPPSTPSSSRHGVAMRFLGAVLAVVAGPIAAQFAADRAAIAAEQLRDLRSRAAAHKLRGNRV